MEPVPGVVVVLPPGVLVVVATVAQNGRVMTSLSRDTAPLRARSRPSMVTPDVAVIDVSAKIEPTNDEPVPSVAELPTIQKMWQDCASLVRTT